MGAETQGNSDTGKESLAQYEADQEKFNAYMPYMMVIPQEEDHVAWIGQLFAAYGLPADGKTPPIVENKTLTDAYELSVKLENDLLPRYEWLIKKAEDRDTAQVLNGIFIQSRWHLVMFDHALRMGHGYGFSRGWGMDAAWMGSRRLRHGAWRDGRLLWRWSWPWKAISGKRQNHRCEGSRGHE